MKKVLSYCLFLIAGMSLGQGLIQNGAYIVVSTGANIVVDGTSGNYTSNGNSIIDLAPNSFLRISSNWINNGSTSIFKDNDGRVELKGAAVNIMGSAMTSFPDLNLTGNGNVYMLTDVLVGGGYSGGGNGILRLQNSKLSLQGRKLILNNRTPNAITFLSSGGIISESNSSLGYGRVQWNIRSGAAGPVFLVPFLNESGIPIHTQITVNSIGTSNLDSGFITLITYPTSNVPTPNNRPLPTGVFNSDNECDGENSERFANRFWIIEDGSYAAKPDLTLDFQYADLDITGSFDKINEQYIGALKWNNTTSKWQFPTVGKLNASANKLNYRAKTNYAGVWTLSDTTPFPKAAFSVVGNCEKDSVAFTDVSGVLADKIVQWQWSFGDGKLSGDQNPVHFYSPEGLFGVQLVIRSQSGCQDTALKTIQIIAAPDAQFTLKDTCENSEVKFESFSWPGAGFIVGQYWDFGDGSAQAIGKSAKHFYGAVGLPEIRLIVYNSKGCKDTARWETYIAPKPYAYSQFTNNCEGSDIAFTNGSTAGGGSLTQYAWDFGNGRRSSNPSDIVNYGDYGTFPVSLSVSNSFGCSDTMVKSIEIYPRAVASFSYSPFEPKMNEPVSFTSTSKHATTWEWSFGDGYFETVETPNHTYATHDVYSVTLVANTNYGCSDTIVIPVNVKSIPLYWFANSFTPGTTEGKNDLFGLETPLRITEFELRIINRWGQKIYHSSDPNKKWDGRVNGELCPTGQYIYYATFKSPEKEIQVYNGTVYLMR